MKNLARLQMCGFAAALVMFSVAGCASTDDAPEPATVPQVAAPDPRIGELQTAMTELLDRLDVMNSRLARLEESGVAVAAAPAQPAPAQTAPIEHAMESAPAETTAAPASAQPMQRALVGAKLAEDYRQAIMLFGRGRHAEARRAFQNVF